MKISGSFLTIQDDQNKIAKIKRSYRLYAL